MKKSDAEGLVGTEPSGRFLVRKDGKGGYVLSVAFKEQCTHHKISVQDDGVLALNETASEFTDLSDLIDHLGKKRKPLKWPVALTEPVNKQSSKAA